MKLSKRENPLIIQRAPFPLALSRRSNFCNVQKISCCCWCSCFYSPVGALPPRNRNGAAPRKIRQQRRLFAHLLLCSAIPLWHGQPAFPNCMHAWIECKRSTDEQHTLYDFIRSHSALDSHGREVLVEVVPEHEKVEEVEVPQPPHCLRPHPGPEFRLPLEPLPGAPLGLVPVAAVVDPRSLKLDCSKISPLTYKLLTRLLLSRT